MKKLLTILILSFMFLQTIFIFNSQVAQAVEPLIIGDVNDDGKVNIIDYVLMKGYVLGITKDLPSIDDKFTGDVNGDDLINSVDYVLLKKYIIKLINVFPKKSTNDFIKVSGKNLMVGNNKVILNGVAFGNEVWSNPSIPSTVHHNEDDFVRVKDMKMNSIRFYLNYGLFEDDSNPYTYKQSGWDWLDKNIAWAKKHGIYLILNMHYPQGGFQSNGGGGALWNNKDNQLRLSALWKEIAKRYKNEPIIAGYDLLNEPNCTSSIEQWKTLANEIVSNIRTVDNNHMIIIERMNGIISDWTKSNDINFFLVNDKNIMYTFHFYSPFEYSHQLTSFTNLKDSDGGKYPDEAIIQPSNDILWSTAIFNNPKLPSGNSDWKYYEGSKFKVSNPEILLGKPVLCNDNNLGTAYFDDFVVKEYDENGTFIRDIYNMDISKSNNWQLWTEDGSGLVTQSIKEGYSNNTSVIILGTAGYSNCYNNMLRFAVTTGHYYSISGWMKGENIQVGAGCSFRIDFEKSASGKIFYRNKEYLKSQIQNFVNWGNTNNVPLYLGEFGLYKECYTKDKGGVNWVKDMIDILSEFGISYNYHCYHEDAFGIYTSGQTLPNENNANTELINLFKSR